MLTRPANYEDELKEEDLDHVQSTIGVTRLQAIIAGYVIIGVFFCAWLAGMF